MTRGLPRAIQGLQLLSCIKKAMDCERLAVRVSDVIVLKSVVLDEGWQTDSRR